MFTNVYPLIRSNVLYLYFGNLIRLLVPFQILLPLSQRKVTRQGILLIPPQDGRKKEGKNKINSHKMFDLHSIRSHFHQHGLQHHFIFLTDSHTFTRMAEIPV